MSNVYVLIGDVHTRIGIADDVHAIIQREPWITAVYWASVPTSKAKLHLDRIGQVLESELLYPDSYTYALSRNSGVARKLISRYGREYRWQCYFYRPTNISASIRIAKEIALGKTLVDPFQLMANRFRYRIGELSNIVIRDCGNRLNVYLTRSDQGEVEGGVYASSSKVICDVPPVVAASVFHYIQTHYDFYIPQADDYRYPANEYYYIEDRDAILDTIHRFVNDGFTLPELVAALKS